MPLCQTIHNWRGVSRQSRARYGQLNDVPVIPDMDEFASVTPDTALQPLGVIPVSVTVSRTMFENGACVVPMKLSAGAIWLAPDTFRIVKLVT